MKPIAVNFNDILFRETGIRANSVTTQSVELMALDTTYSLRFIKRTVADREILFVGLYDPAEKPVQDIQIHCAGQTYETGAAEHPDTAAIPLTAGASRSDFNLTCTSLDLNVEVSVQLEQVHPESVEAESTASDFAMKLLNSVQRDLKENPAPASSVCPAEEMVLAYAYHELSGEEKISVGNHVHECLDCLDMVLTARYAEEAAKDMAEAPLPDWLTNPAATAVSNLVESPKEKIIPWPYPSVKDMIHDIQKRWDKMLEWPLAAMQSFNIENALLAAVFNPKCLSEHAADHDGEIITAKWLVLEDGKITDIRPVDVQIYDLQITGNQIEFTGELPPELRHEDITLRFGWITPEGNLTPLKYERGEVLNEFFSRCLIAENDLDPQGKLKMLIMKFK